MRIKNFFTAYADEFGEVAVWVEEGHFISQHKGAGRSDIWTEPERVMSIWELRQAAAALYDGGWRSDDREQLAGEYSLAPEEVEVIIEVLEELEEMEESIK